MACGATTSTTTTPTTAEDESNALTSSNLGCGGEGCQSWRLQAELSRLQQEKLLLAYSHADDQRRLHEHEVQLQLLEREVGEAQQDLGSKKEISKLKEEKEEQEEQIQKLKKLLADIESELQGNMEDG